MAKIVMLITFIIFFSNNTANNRFGPIIPKLPYEYII